MAILFDFVNSPVSVIHNIRDFRHMPFVNINCCMYSISVKMALYDTYVWVGLGCMKRDLHVYILC